MKTITQHRFFTLCASVLYVLSAGHPVLADDTEVLVGPGGQAWATPNVLFVMDTSGSMRTKDGFILSDGSTDDRTRLEIVQEAFSDLMNNNAGFNVALMRFDSGGSGGYFVSPMQELNDSTRDSIIDASNDLSAGGNTPLSETFYEAALFWSGSSVDYGSGKNVTGVPDNGNYISPITSECQRNYTILLTDGAPNKDDDADSKIATMTGSNCTGNCLDEVAGYLYTTDQNTNIADNQIVETFTIGFADGAGQQLLTDTARAGGGTPIPGGTNDHDLTAANSAELATAFTDILSAITDTNSSFAAPALAANSFNGIAHFNKLYFTLFEPDAAPKWVGNVKPYAIDDNFNLVDAGDNDAIDANGFFEPTSRSFWSLTADGASIGAGGANDKLPAAASRNLYTYTGDYSTTGPYTLSSASNALENSGPSSLTAAMLGMSNVNPAAFSAVLDTMRAAPLGAPLHSKPALVIYGGQENAPELTLFVATNDGFIHALNASTGVEKFAFIPQELLPNLPTLAGGTGSVVYGMDGDITVWVNDTDQNIDSTDGDFVYVYAGMRRGGNNYYAIDATTLTAPTLKWVIKGGPGGTPGFEELGQSWSKPTLTTINYGPSPGTKKVLIFGGGYDTAQDARPLNTVADTTGRAIFIVDADTGALLWSASPTTGTNTPILSPSLTHSIPSDVRLLDSDLDGNTDRLYVGDMGGKIFRVDLQASASGMTGDGVVFANLGGASTAENRRFYYPPDVVVTQSYGASPYVSVNIGSGYRAHPLNLLANGVPVDVADDRFYSLRDPYVTGIIPNNFTAITNGSGDLLDITGLPVLSAGNTTTLNGIDGWRISLGNVGEKVLAPSITINGEIFFTTYTPPESVPAANCAPPPGVGRLYRISLFDGSPVADQNNDSDANDIVDRVNELERPGIPSEPSAMFRKNDGTGRVQIVHCEGTECAALPDAIQIQPTYWQDGQ